MSFLTRTRVDLGKAQTVTIVKGRVQSHFDEQELAKAVKGVVS
jgi:hypothetical protein